jgi:DNA-binding MarR family transcriptional regulator
VTNSLADQWLTHLRACAQMSQAVERALSERHGLCASAYEIMDVMSREHDWIRAGALSSRCSRSQPQVSRLVTQMIDAGYAERKPSPGDGRGFHVRLTASGDSLFREASGTMEGVLRQLADEDAGTRALMIQPASSSTLAVTATLLDWPDVRLSR